MNALRRVREKITAALADGVQLCHRLGARHDEYGARSAGYCHCGPGCLRSKHPTRGISGRLAVRTTQILETAAAAPPSNNRSSSSPIEYEMLLHSAALAA